MSTNPSPSNADILTQLTWLADAPLFIDTEQVQRFFDAVVHPNSKVASLLQSSGQGVDKTYEGKGKASLGLPKVLDDVFSLSLGLEEKQQSNQGQTITYVPIDNPERQLIALTVHYVDKKASRIFLVTDPTKPEWRQPSMISQAPRPLVFLELPGAEQNTSGGLGTMLVPTAAEFTNGAIVPIYPELARKNGERPPSYPEVAASAEELRKDRKVYWNWFREEFSPRQAMQVVEQIAAKNGRLQWIDFRLPLSNEGDTLHLHVRPGGKYDTGDFAYNFIKRGNKHGIRLVGTLKSEPDMNVLAIYER